MALFELYIGEYLEHHIADVVTQGVARKADMKGFYTLRFLKDGEIVGRRLKMN